MQHSLHACARARVGGQRRVGVENVRVDRQEIWRENCKLSSIDSPDWLDTRDRSAKTRWRVRAFELGKTARKVNTAVGVELGDIPTRGARKMARDRDHIPELSPRR